MKYEYEDIRKAMLENKDKLLEREFTATKAGKKATKLVCKALNKPNSLKSELKYFLIDNGHSAEKAKEIVAGAKEAGGFWRKGKAREKLAHNHPDLIVIGIAHYLKQDIQLQPKLRSAFNDFIDNFMEFYSIPAKPVEGPTMEKKSIPKKVKAVVKKVIPKASSAKAVKGNPKASPSNPKVIPVQPKKVQGVKKRSHHKKAK